MKVLVHIAKPVEKVRVLSKWQKQNGCKSEKFWSVQLQKNSGKQYFSLTHSCTLHASWVLLG